MGAISEIGKSASEFRVEHSEPGVRVGLGLGTGVYREFFPRFLNRIGFSNRRGSLN